MKNHAGKTSLDSLEPLPDTRRDRGSDAAERSPNAGLDAFVLAGGVAKGAFTAGALSALTVAGSGLSLATRRIVAASSGSLNAAYFAASVHAGTVDTAGAELEEIWLREATFEAFDLSLNGMATLAGISTFKKLRELLARHIQPQLGGRPIDLRLVTTNAAGSMGLIAGSPATTFEHVFRFDGSVFDSEEGLDALFTAVGASAAFPGAFLPVQASIGGCVVPCMDGGIVNNAPLKHAIGDTRDVSRVFVITPYPRVLGEVPDLRGLALASYLAEMLIHERLFRDLREAEDVNASLERLDHALPDDGQRAAVLAAIGWTGRKRIQLVEIRPPSPLAGGAFDGLFSKQLRAEYIEAGKTAARSWIAEHFNHAA